MEFLDTYDEYMNKTGTESREFVHENGLWHKTAHCWLYDDAGNVYFQIRADSGKLYTTASGHVLAGETMRDAMKREIKEEIGIDINVDNAIPLEVDFWQQDKIKNGKPWHDRAFGHVYAAKMPSGHTDFHFQPEEVSGLVRINAKDCLDLFIDKKDSVQATKITADSVANITVTKQDFLTYPNEGAIVLLHLFIKLEA